VLGKNSKRRAKANHCLSIERKRRFRNEEVSSPRINSDITCLWAEWNPVSRWRDLSLGLSIKRVNLGLHAKGDAQVEKLQGMKPMEGTGAEELVVVMKDL
jgi:hypothetical protein